MDNHLCHPVIISHKLVQDTDSKVVVVVVVFFFFHGEMKDCPPTEQVSHLVQHIKHLCNSLSVCLFRTWSRC